MKACLRPRRGLFLILTAILLLAAACSQEPGTAVNTVSDPQPGIAHSPVTVIHNAVIYTVDDARPVAGAMAFNSDGVILQLGSAEEVRAAYPDANMRDLEGRAVVPGLIDSHAHLSNLALSLTRAQLVGTADKAEIIRRLEEHETSLSDDDWLLGYGWDQNDWPVQEFPSRQDLDTQFPQRPVWLVRIDGHAAWGNSAALAMADRDLAGDWQMEGGFVHRDSQGRATGVLIDNARALVEKAIPRESEQLLDEALGLALHQMISLGMTGVHDAGIDRSTIERYVRHIEAGRFPARVYAMTDGAGATLDWLCSLGGITHDSNRLFARSVKLYMDGALGSRGAALLEDYSDEPGNRGLLFLQPDVLRAQVAKAMSCGFQVAVHAIGDQGNRAVLDALQAESGNYPENPGRHRLEHAQTLTETDLARFAELSVIVAMQPTHATSDMYWVEQRLGPQRIRYAYAWRSLLDSGARLALGSDFPVEEVNPLHGFYAAVARRDLKGWPEGGWYPEEAISRSEALRGFTLDAAYAGFMEHLVGSLEAGKRADFVILDRDIMTMPEAEIPLTRVLETWLDGERVFAAQSPGQSPITGVRVKGQSKNSQS